MKKESAGRQLSILLVFVLAVAAVFLLAFSRQGSGPEKKARFVLEQLLSCTVHIDSAVDANAASGSEPGLVSVDDSGLTAYLNAQFSDSMTASCLQQLMANRTVTQVTRLAEQLGDPLEATGLTLTKRSGEADSYDFSADLQTAAGRTTAASASGTITMVKEDGVWKAARITLNVK